MNIGYVKIFYPTMATIHQNASGLVPGRGRGVSGDREPARCCVYTIVFAWYVVSGVEV